MDKNIMLLCLCFALIFFAFNGVQQYVTSFFSAAGMASVGFTALIIVYVFFILSDPLSAVLVSKYGAKKAMFAGSFVYALFILLLPGKSAYAIYAGAALLGLGAAMLWTGQNSYLIRASSEDKRGASSGLFTSAQSLASGLGILTLGFAIPVLSFGPSFTFFAVLPLAGTALLLRLEDVRGVKSAGRWRAVKKSFSSVTALRMSSICMIANFVFGLVIGSLPIKLGAAIGIRDTGILLALFFVCPAAFSTILGRLSDVRGRPALTAASYALLLAGLVVLSASQQALFLVAGVIVLALSSAMIQPIAYAIVGDLSTETNLEALTGLFWMVKSGGVLVALILAQALIGQPALLYAASIVVVLASAAIVLPKLKSGVESTRLQIAKEFR